MGTALPASRARAGRAARACRPPPRSRAGARHRRPRAAMRSTPSRAASEPISRAWPRTDSTVARATSASGAQPALVQDRRVDSVPARAEARLRDRLGVRMLARRRLVERPRGERVHQRGQRAGVVERRLCVHLPHLDGSEPLMGANVPPDERCRPRSRPPPPPRPPPAAYSSQSRNARGTPRRGYALTIEKRALARPESNPNQYGDAAASPWSRGRLSRSAFSTRTADSGSGMPTCTCSAHSGVRRMRPRDQPVEPAIALLLDELHVAVRGRRVQADRHQLRPHLRGRRRGHLPALLQLRARLGRVAADRGAQLHLRRVCLVVGQRLGQVDLRQHPLGHVGEAVIARVDQQHLLLDAEASVGRRIRRGHRRGTYCASAERAAIRPNTSAAARPLA